MAHREGLGLVALLGWLRAERRVAAKSNERTRRLDTDAKAVQLLTIHGSKGQQYPIVYLPELFNCWPGNATEYLFHDGDVPERSTSAVARFRRRPPPRVPGRSCA